jgi:hypothetical protein
MNLSGTIVGHMARDLRPGPWPVKTARYLGRPDPHFAGYGRPDPVAGRAMGRFLVPQTECGPVSWPVKPASGPASTAPYKSCAPGLTLTPSLPIPAPRPAAPRAPA